MKMKFLESPYIGDLHKQILYNRGIENLDKLRNPDWSDYVSPEKFHNMSRAVERFLQAIKNKENIVVIVDPDQDGISSSSELCYFFPQIKPIFHTGKQHGLSDDEVFSKIMLDKEIDLLLLPDAGSNDIIELELLAEKGIDSIIIDHHPIDLFEKHKKVYDDHEKIIIVNCHHPFNQETDESLTGAGMVFKFLELINKQYPLEITNVLDLVAIGQIGDASDVSINSIRKLVLYGLHNIHNPLIKKAIDKKTNGIEPTIQDMSYGFIPIVNAVCRVGTIQEKKMLFKALIQDKSLFKERIVPKRRKNKETGKMMMVQMKVNGFDDTLEELLKVKERQSEIVKAVVEGIKKSKERLFNSTGIAFVKIPKLENGNVTGLIAQKISTELGKPCLMFQEEDDGTLKGSGRSNDKWITSLKDWCNDTGLFISAQGHDNAFGVTISKDNFFKAIEQSKTIEKNEKCYFVDEMYTHRQSIIKHLKDDIETAFDLRDIYGGSITEPLFGFSNVEIKKSDIAVYNKVTQIKCGNIIFISFTPPQWLNDLQYGFSPSVRLNIVGKPLISQWRGRRQHQIVIEDIELAPQKITEENFCF